MKRSLKAVFLAVVLVLTMLFSGCAGQGVTDEKSLYEKILNTLSTMENYFAEATVRYISNNNANEYRTTQHVKGTGEYRIEVIGPEDVAGNITVFDGKTICQFNTKIKGQIAVGTNESAERAEILLTSFTKNYFASQEVSVSVASIGDNDDITVLEAKVPGDHVYLQTEKLWVDNKTLLPIQLVVYDQEGGERIVVTYHKIEYNVKMNDELFIVER